MSDLQKLMDYIGAPQEILRFDNFKTAVTQILELDYKLIRIKIEQSFDPMRYWFECEENSSISYLVAELSNTMNAEH